MNTPKRLLCLGVSCAYFSVSWLRRSLRHVSGNENPGTCVVLYYHGISPQQRAQFARQMDVLLHHTVPIRADFATPLPKNGRFACVTFDDGLVSFAERALPELEKRGIPAAIFAVSGKLGQEPDWANYSDEPLTTERTMTSSQLREIADRALIGSHTTTHPMLTKLSETEAARELEESRKALEGLLNKNVTLFSFPYGDFNDALIKWSSAAGYKRVFTTLPFAFESESGAEASVVGRISVEPTDWPLEFRLKVLGAYQWLPIAFAVKRNIQFLFNKN